MGVSLSDVLYVYIKRVEPHFINLSYKIVPRISTLGVYRNSINFYERHDNKFEFGITFTKDVYHDISYRIKCI